MAPRSGRVIARNLANIVGTYVREGDELLTIAEPTEKELLAVVHQDDIEELRGALAEEVPIRQATSPTSSSPISSLGSSPAPLQTSP